jgi:hypothetical protein
LVCGIFKPRPYGFEEDWYRRWESEYSGVLKTRKLLISRPAKNPRYYKIAFNWNVSGTQEFYLFSSRQIPKSYLKPNLLVPN